MPLVAHTPLPSFDQLRKNGEEILATKSNHFGRYTVYEIHNEKYFNYMNRES